MIDIDELEKLILLLKANKVQQFKSDTVQLVFDPTAFYEPREKLKEEPEYGY